MAAAVPPTARRSAPGARAPSSRARAAGSAESKRPPRGWPLPWVASRSMHLLNAGEQPAARAVGRLDEVPHLFEAHRLGARGLAHHAGEAHAGPALVGLGGELEKIGVQRHAVGMLTGGLPLRAKHAENLAGGELAGIVQRSRI